MRPEEENEMRIAIVCLSAGLVCAGSAVAFQNASDDASDAVYDNGWQNGDDGGSGWSGGWELTSYVSAQGSAALQNLATSTGNGGGDIDTAGRAFHLSASGGGESSAVRYLTAPLAVGEVVGFDIDATSVPGVGTAEMNLLGSGPARLRVGQISSSIDVMDLAGLHQSGILANGDPVRAQITLTGADTYSATLTPLVGSPVTISGTLLGSGSIDYLGFDVSQPGVATREMYFNRITVPEPAGTELATCAFGALAFVARRTRRKCHWWDRDAASHV
jgi:hypothetical protein